MEAKVKVDTDTDIIMDQATLVPSGLKRKLDFNTPLFDLPFAEEEVTTGSREEEMKVEEEEDVKLEEGELPRKKMKLVSESLLLLLVLSLRV